MLLARVALVTTLMLAPLYSQVPGKKGLQTSVFRLRVQCAPSRTEACGSRSYYAVSSAPAGWAECWLPTQVYFKVAHPSAVEEVSVVGINIPIEVGEAIVMPGDGVLGASDGVVFIPPHLVKAIVDSADLAHQG